MRKVQIIMLIPLLLLACKTVQIQPKGYKIVKIKDTVFSTVTVVDTLKVLRSSDTTKIQLPIHKVTNKPIVKKSKHATLKIKKVNGQLQVECIADELKEIVEIQKETIKHYKELYQKEHEKVVVQKSKTPEWIKPFVWIGIGALVIVVLKIIK